MSDDLLQQALDALVYHVEQTRPIQRTTEAIDALRLRLTRVKPVQQQAEPVGDVVGEASFSGVSSNPTITNCVAWRVELPYGTKLYAAPPAVQGEPECTLDTFVHGTRGNRYCCDRCGKLYAQHPLPHDDAPDTQQQAEPVRPVELKCPHCQYYTWTFAAPPADDEAVRLLRETGDWLEAIHTGLTADGESQAAHRVFVLIERIDAYLAKVTR